MSQPRRDPAGWHLVRKPGQDKPAGGTRASLRGTSQRYGLTHYHPAKARNAYPSLNQAAMRAFFLTLSHHSTWC
jgi:hypothetical protein